MKLEPKELLAKITPLVKKAMEYSTFIFVIIVLGLFGFIVLRIRTLVASEPSDDDALVAQSVRIDEEAIKRIESLEDANVQVKSLFKEARNNPFNE